LLRKKNLPLLVALLALALFALARFAPLSASAATDELLMDVPKQPVPAYDFKATLLTGERVKLSDYRGKVVFLNFWATWCPPCRAEMPAMEKLQQKFQGRPFQMLAVNFMETRAKAKAFVDKMKLTFPIVMDPHGVIGKNYNAENLPVTYIIDKQGNVIRRAIGPRVWDGPEAVALFEKLVAE
jgi:peroxiredoxin